MPKHEPEIPKLRGRGRPKGQSVKVAERTKTLREIASVYAEEAVNVLARIAMDETAPHSARVSAVNSLLDRGFGRAAQAEPTQADSSDKPLQRIERVVIDVPVVAKPVKGKAAV